MRSVSSPPRPTARYRRAVAASAAVAIAAAGCLSTTHAGAQSHPAATAAAHRGAPVSGSYANRAAANFASLVHRVPASAPSYLAPGSNPAVLPGPILIADKHNSRLLIVNPQGQIVWQFPRPGDLAPGQTFLVPDDAFFTPDGRYIIATAEGNFAITVVSIRTHRIVWRYGHPAVPGYGPGYLDNPDDAMMLPDGYVVLADIKNCRLDVIAPGGTALVHTFGTTGTCYHNPPTTFGSPNGMFPLPNGNYLITEINGDWVDEMTPSGQILWSAHPPGFDYPSDSNQYSPGVYLSVNYASPGALDLFNRNSQLIYQYAPTGANGVPALNMPSLAMPLPNGDILMNDDHNDRVVVLDPRTSKIVWQFGHTGVPGSAPGYLDVPDGVDVSPPYSMMVVHASAMTAPPLGTTIGTTVPAGGIAGALPGDVPVRGVPAGADYAAP